MNASQDQTDCVDRARFVESCGARDDSPSWNLDRVKESEQGCASECSKVKYKGQAVELDAQLADTAAWGERGRMQDQGERRECDDTCRQR